MSSSLLDVLSDELSKFFQPIRDVVENPVLLERLLPEIGAESETAGGDSLASALGAIVALLDDLDKLSTQASPSFSGVADVLSASEKAFTALRALDQSGGPSAALTDFSRDLIDFLVETYLAGWHPLARQILALLTLLDPVEAQDLTPAVIAGGKIVRSSFRVDRFHLERISKLLSDPAGTLRDAYIVNSLLTVADANASAGRLFPRILGILRTLDVSCRYGFTQGDEEILGDAAALVDHALVVYAADRHKGASAEAGVVFTFSSADRGDLGLLASPFGSLTLKTQQGPWALELDFTAQVQGVAYGRHGVTLVASVASAEVTGGFTATLEAPNSEPAYLMGSANGTRIEVGGSTLAAKTTLSEASRSVALSANVSKSAIVISPGDGDGFLQSVLPAKGLRADFDLGIAWSSARGLSFSGSAGLDATLSVGLSLGGVLTIPTVHLGLKAGDTGLQIEVSATIGLSIGVIQALIDRLGLEADITFPRDGGNLGIADLDLGFKLPSGVGLAINSAGVSGGGVLTTNPAAHEYSGMLQLQFDDIALQAFGLITTEVAGGSGYSLLAMIDADFPPIQLGWGFTLNGAGGLLAVHRTADTDKLRAALKADKLSTILFPKSAISNAPLVLAQLDALFPTAQGRFLFGPMALIGWGTPTVLTVALAVILELPEPVRILLLARLAVRLPSATAPLVKINMDALGVLDLSQGQFSLDATLYDSKITGFTLSGDMALRANWGTQREFLLAIGGFHPQFTPPAGFPSLQRVTVDMPSASISKMRLAAYLAITSNTLQFGADLDVYIGVPGFGLAGHLAFDAMLQYVPLHFDADISASIGLMAGSDTLMSVGLDATLSGARTLAHRRQVQDPFLLLRHSHIVLGDVGQRWLVYPNRAGRCLGALDSCLCGLTQLGYSAAEQRASARLAAIAEWRDRHRKSDGAPRGARASGAARPADHALRGVTDKGGSIDVQHYFLHSRNVVWQRHEGVGRLCPCPVLRSHGRAEAGRTIL